MITVYHDNDFNLLERIILLYALCVKSATVPLVYSK